MSIDVRVRGRDGHLYRLHPLTREDRDRAISAAHLLVRGEHLSIRRAQSVMAQRWGINRSVGAIHADLTNFVCEHCEND